MARKMIKKKLLTIEDLIKFCVDQKFYQFNSKDSGYQISVQVPATFEVDEDVDEAHRGMLRLKIKIFHTGLNRNGSYISEDAAKAAMPSIKNRPVLAAIHQLDSGEWDFESHNVEIIENEDGTQEVNYIEKQVGSFSEDDPFFEYDKNVNKTFVCSYAYIPEQYTRAADIIRRKNGTKNSCELAIDEFAYNAKEKYLDFKAFHVSASTLLGASADGTPIGEGMLGSRADIADFSNQNNSALQTEYNENFMNNVLSKLDTILIHLDVNEPQQKGDKFNPMKFEELLTKYNKTEADVTFDYHNMTDEELEEAFKIFEATESEVDIVEELEVEPETDPVEEEVFVQGKIVAVNEAGDCTISYNISHEDIRSALYALLAPYEESDNEWYFIESVYDDYFVYGNWSDTKIYKQEYSKDEDVVSFVGERTELFKELLTASEKAQLESMRANYSELVAYKAGKELEEQRELKMQELSNEAYAVLSDVDTFKALHENMDNYTVEEIRTKAKEIFADYVLEHGQFAANNTKTAKFISINKGPSPEDVEKPYGGLLDELK